MLSTKPSVTMGIVFNVDKVTLLMIHISWMFFTFWAKIKGIPNHDIFQIEFYGHYWLFQEVSSTKCGVEDLFWDVKWDF